MRLTALRAPTLIVLLLLQLKESAAITSLSTPIRLQALCHSKRIPTLKSVAASSAVDAKRRKIDQDFVRISAPAFVQFVAQPLAQLIDTAYLGRLGAIPLGGAGAAIAIQYSAGKLYNDPLLRTAISIVAAQEGSAPAERANAVSTALLLALVIGVVQGASFLLLGAQLLTASCVGPLSPMREAALGYLRVSALGAPSATLWLAANGIFRGLGDTATPLILALTFTAINAILDPIFIFKLNMGAAGAAAGTAIAQTIALVPLLWTLQRKLRPPVETAAVGSSGIRDWPVIGLFAPQNGLSALVSSVIDYLRAGSYVLLRSVAKISAYSICAREAAKLGAASIAAHNMCFQLGVATTQLCESIAIATQALLAMEIGDAAKARPAGADDPADGATVDAADEPATSSSLQAAVSDQWAMRRAAVRHILSRALWGGGVIAGSLSMVTLLNRKRVIDGLTTVPEVRVVAYGVMPLVLLCQTLKGLAYPVNGALMGALDWRASAVAMWAAQAVSVLAMGFWSRGFTCPLTLNKLWAALAALFATQIVAGLVRIASRTGIWKVLGKE